MKNLEIEIVFNEFALFNSSDVNCNDNQEDEWAEGTLGNPSNLSYQSLGAITYKDGVRS